MIVMMICHYDDTNTSGGLDKQARLLSRTLKARGEDVVMLSSTRKLSRAGWTVEDGVPVRLFWTYASPQISGRFLPAALIWAFQLFLWIAWNRRRVNVIHVHQIRIHAFVAAIARRLFGIRSILKSATGGVGADILTIGSRKYFGRRGRAFVIHNSDVFVATTESIRQDLLQAGVAESAITLIPNGLNLKSSQPGGVSVGNRHRRCLFLGRLAPDKNGPALTRAALDSSVALGLVVDIYGRGREAPIVETLVAEQPDQGVRYMGFIDDPSLILGAYGWLILPSNGEGLSNAMIEAMAAGVVPVTTQVSGCVDHIVAGKTGLFLDGVSEAEITDGLIRVSRTSEQEWRDMSAEVQRLATSQFDIAVVASAYSNLYRSLDKAARPA